MLRVFHHNLKQNPTMAVAFLLGAALAQTTESHALEGWVVACGWYLNKLVISSILKHLFSTHQG